MSYVCYAYQLFRVTILNIILIFVRRGPCPWKNEAVCIRLPIPAAMRPKALVCGSSPAEIAGSNPAGGVDVCLL
jgi:hypothetical protein